MRAQILPDGVPRTRRTILFRGEHVDERSTARHQSGQGLRLLVGQRAWLRPDPLGEPGQHLGIDGVGFGQLPGGFGKIAELRVLTTMAGIPARIAGLLSKIDSRPLFLLPVRIGTDVKSSNLPRRAPR